MSDLKETLYKACRLEWEKCDKLLAEAPTTVQESKELHEAAIARKALYNVIKQAGMVEDYTRWLIWMVNQAEIDKT